jgi:SAM-dependent methyltransferase
MTDVDPARYGQTWAPIYDEVHAYLDPTAAVDALHALAAGGRALELGIGTGRVALPLASRGVAVHGIEASEAMLAHLRAKPGGAELPVTVGDFTAVAADGEYALIYVVFNTLYGLMTQEAQVACFRNVAARLTPGGAFVVEAFVPDPTRFDRRQRTQVNQITPEQVELLVTRHDPVAQRVTSQHVTFGGGGVQLHYVEIRYTWPSELDLMARLAGLRLRERWAWWDRTPFTSDSESHVSVWEKL